ncbi:hypothetical protein KSC_030540 [Ktedonobacter sp. SOSP1-52]|uniref:hypothetical protein n=1 Tax=Ktedonobacter sp. SOSP1-52 TaxID=2778366 RepID=UPI00191679DD|nr:hypothetical protein [Ktedonobacter sp. SOSP1-52]GHO64162.1 hypothetical protein KSC_030540 [Ktedonobacter sp. SOSP1-52]
MNALVQKLSEREHPLTLGGPSPSLEAFQQRLENPGYVFIKFTDTQGGTDLGVRIDKDATDITRANFAEGTGIVHVEGTLILNYVRVRCYAEIDLQTLNGTGRLAILEEIHSSFEEAIQDRV